MFKEKINGFTILETLISIMLIAILFGIIISSSNLSNRLISEIQNKDTFKNEILEFQNTILNNFILSEEIYLDSNIIRFIKNDSNSIVVRSNDHFTEIYENETLVKSHEFIDLFSKYSMSRNIENLKIEFITKSGNFNLSLYRDITLSKYYGLFSKKESND